MDLEMINHLRRCRTCCRTFSSPEEKVPITELISNMYKRIMKSDLAVNTNSLSNCICMKCLVSLNKSIKFRNILSESRSKIKNFMDCGFSDPNIVVKTEIFDLTSPKKEGCEDNAPILIETDIEMTIDTVASVSPLPKTINEAEQGTASLLPIITTVTSLPITTLEPEQPETSDVNTQFINATDSDMSDSDMTDSDMTEIYLSETTASPPSVTDEPEKLETSEKSQIDNTEALLTFPDDYFDEIALDYVPIKPFEVKSELKIEVKSELQIEEHSTDDSFEGPQFSIVEDEDMKLESEIEVEKPRFNDSFGEAQFVIEEPHDNLTPNTPDAESRPITPVDDSCAPTADEPDKQQTIFQDVTVYIRCQKCQSFIVKDLIHNHMALKHSLTVKVKRLLRQSFPKYVCKKCLSFFRTRGSLVKHLESKTKDR